MSRALVLGLLAVVCPSRVTGQERLVRRFGPEQGLYGSTVSSLVQDSTGFIWVGTQAGLFRYDGLEFRRWAPETLDRVIRALSVSPAGQLIALRDDGILHEITASSARPVSGPDGAPLRVRAAAFAADGILWVAQGSRILLRDGRGRWRTLPMDLLGGEQPRRLRANGAGAVDVLTDVAVWELTRHGSGRRLASAHVPLDVLSLEDGRRVGLGADGVFDLDGGRRVTRFVAPGRPIALVRRGRAIWASYDLGLVLLPPDEPPRLLRESEGMVGGGPLLVDREGTLWVGTFTGLFKYPEPETLIWAERHGLAASTARFVRKTGPWVWVATWGGTGYVRATPGGWIARTVFAFPAVGMLLLDGRGRVWVGTGKELVAVRQGRVLHRMAAVRGEVEGMARAADGALWIAGEGGLVLVEPDLRTARRPADTPFEAGAEVNAVLEDGDGRLWVASGERICETAAGALRSGRVPAWTCDSLPGARRVQALLESPRGVVWAASLRAGLQRRVAGRWVRFPAGLTLPSHQANNLAPSPRGGIWVPNYGEPIRIAPPGWGVVERLSGWYGLPAAAVWDVLEEEDGTLWLTTDHGLVRVPAATRFASLSPPPVALVEARVDTVSVPLDRALRLPSRSNRLELRFAALSFRDPALIRYQVRLSTDGAWQDTRGQPFFRWVDLPAGRYHAEVRASLDGSNWTAAPAAFRFTVDPPWFRRPWAIAGFLVAAGALAFAWYRARIAHLVGLERQRTRIAMDLHDELGSGLGSIGILSGVLTAAEGVDRAQVSREIAQTAEELGSALSDIVWALDPRADTLQQLAARLAEHGTRLFAGDAVEFTTRFPQAWPATRLPPAVRRTVLLVGLEALHNAARHAAARHVTLSLEPRAGAWDLAVSDDGRGLPKGTLAHQGPGLGLPSMRQRAADIGGEITWHHPPGGGTVVRLRFATARRSLDSLARRLRGRLA